MRPNASMKASASLRLLSSFFLLVCLGACGGGGGSSEVATPPLALTPTAEPVGFSTPEVLPDGWKVSANPDVNESVFNDLGERVHRGDFFPLDSIAVAHRGELIVDAVLRTTVDSQDELVGNLDPAVHAQFSISKSMAAILVGIAIDEGQIDAVSQSYLSLFPYDPENLANPDPRKLDMTLGHALSMGAGLQWNEFDPYYDQADNQLLSFHAAHTDWAEALFDLPIAHTPGTVFAYNTVLSTSLGQAIENSQTLALEDYINSKLMMPLDISTVKVLRTPTNLPDLGRGIFISSRDLAKLGQLVLDGGVWNGRRIVSEAWLAEMLMLRFEQAWLNPAAFSWQVTGYGYQWWLGTLTVDDVTYPTWAARGFGQQLLMVVPDLQLVVAANSQGYGEGTSEELLFQLIADHLVPAVTQNQ